MLDISMFNNSQVLMGVYFLLGIPLLGLLGYMFDQVRKNKPSDDRKDGWISTFIKFPFLFFYMAPFAYLYMSVKNRDIKGIIVFIVTVALIMFAFSIGNQAVASGK